MFSAVTSFINKKTLFVEIFAVFLISFALYFSTAAFACDGSSCVVSSVNAPVRSWVYYSTSERDLSGAYTNNTGYEMELRVSAYGGNPNNNRCGFSIHVDGIIVPDHFVNNSLGNAVCEATANIPNGSSYSVGNDGWSDITLSQWSEFCAVSPVIIQCSDGLDNDGDGKIDLVDPACHTDGDSNNAASYNVSLNSENSAPVITLLGDNPANITVGHVFTDPKATGYDPEDGDITGNIVIAGIVDTSAAGTYTLRYNLKDKNGLAAVEKARTVIVKVVSTSTCVADVDVMLVIDRSPSMDGSPLAAAKLAAGSFVDTLRSNGDRSGLSVYSGSAFLGYPLSNNFAELKNSINSISTIGSNGTNIGAGIKIANDEIVAHGRIGVKKVIIFLSDGNANVPSPKPEEYAQSEADKAKIAGNTIYTIGLKSPGALPGYGLNETLLRNISSGSGFYYYAPSESDLVSIYLAIAKKECENNPPVITVIGDNPLNITVGQTFTDPGATALDQEDGNLTGSIVTTGTVNTAVVGNYTIHYNVKDRNNLSAEEKSRLVSVNAVRPQCSDGIDNDSDGKIDIADPACHSDGDPGNHLSYTPNIDRENLAPVISLIGDNPLNITVGQTFTDPGATALDQEDGNLTGSILVTGTVTTTTPGTYTLHYNVKDKNGLSANEVTRLVTVIASCSNLTTVISDTTNSILGEGNALLTYSGHPLWTAHIPGALWIWSSYEAQNTEVSVEPTP